MVAERILLIDDDQSLLDGLKRAHGRRFNLTTFARPVEAIQEMQRNPGYAAVFCDYQMPGINGAACLARIQAISPSTVRVLLTGNNDLDTAIDAIHRGNIFRFLRKPCDPDVFAKCAQDALQMHHMLQGERDLLQNTLGAAVQVLGDVLALVNPQAFGRTGRICHYVRALCKKRAVPDPWEYEVAASLSLLGMVSVPPDIVTASVLGADLSTEQRAIIGRHPVVGSDLLRSIPRLEKVANIVRYQAKRYDGDGLPTDAIAGDKIPEGARLLAAAMELEARTARGESVSEALGTMASMAGRFDPAVLVDIAEVEHPSAGATVATVSLQRVSAGYVLDQDIVHSCGSLVVPKGQVITDSMLARLRSYADLGHIPRKIQVLVPGPKA